MLFPRWILSLGWVFALGVSAAPPPAKPLPAEWRHVQPVTVASSGLVRFAVPLATLEAARPGWEDLRVLDAQGQPITRRFAAFDHFAP